MQQNTIQTATGSFDQAKPTEQCKKPVMSGDYFFYTEDQPRLFVKLSESKISKDALNSVLDTPVEITFELKKGSWRDSIPNPNANQTYIAVLSVKRKEEKSE